LRFLAKLNFGIPPKFAIFREAENSEFRRCLRFLAKLNFGIPPMFAIFSEAEFRNSAEVCDF
jgi:hypothetical protein